MTWQVGRGRALRSEDSRGVRRAGGWWWRGTQPPCEPRSAPSFPPSHPPCPARRQRHARPSLAGWRTAGTERHCRRRAFHSSAAAGRGVSGQRGRVKKKKTTEDERGGEVLLALLPSGTSVTPLKAWRVAGRGQGEGRRERGGRRGQLPRLAGITPAMMVATRPAGPAGLARMRAAPPRRGTEPAERGTTEDQCRTRRYVALVRKARPKAPGVCPANRHGRATAAMTPDTRSATLASS